MLKVSMSARRYLICLHETAIVELLVFSLKWSLHFPLDLLFVDILGFLVLPPEC